MSATPPTTVIAFETDSSRNMPDVLWHIANRYDAVLVPVNPTGCDVDFSFYEN